MTLTELTSVWTPLSALAAVVSGVVLGLGVGWVATNPTYSAGVASALRVATTTALFFISAGLLFYALQTLASYLSHDCLWYRVPSRYVQWVVFSIAIGVTTFLLVRRDRSARRRRAHDQAVAERESPHEFLGG